MKQDEVPRPFLVPKSTITLLFVGWLILWLVGGRDGLLAIQPDQEMKIGSVFGALALELISLFWLAGWITALTWNKFLRADAQEKEYFLRDNADSIEYDSQSIPTLKNRFAWPAKILVGLVLLGLPFSIMALGTKDASDQSCYWDDQQGEVFCSSGWNFWILEIHLFAFLALLALHFFVAGRIYRAKFVDVGKS